MLERGQDEVHSSVILPWMEKWQPEAPRPERAWKSQQTTVRPLFLFPLLDPDQHLLH
jgi:hypothetical protein